MIKVITDNGETIIAENAAELSGKIGDIFREDPNPDVMLTYVVTRQPTSRRMAPTT